MRGDVFLDEGFYAMGEVRFVGASIGGQLVCSGGKFENPRGDAFSVDGATIKGSVFLDNEFHATGRVRLLGTVMEGQLNCRRGKFENSGGVALDADGAIVKGNALLDNQFCSKGKVRLVGTVVKGQLSCRGGRFDSLNLAYANVRALVDDRQAWPEQGRLRLEGFKYQALAGKNTPKDAKSRLEWLRRQPRFAPGTYDQLASVFSQMGLENDAVEVMIAKHEDWIRLGTLSRTRKIWKRILGWTTGYGYQSRKSLLWLFAFFSIGFLLFRLGECFDVFVPSSSTVLMSQIYQQTGQPPQGYPEFHAWLYSLDTLIPVVDLYQEKFWLPDTGSMWGWIVFIYLRFHILAGWIFFTLFAASVTGLVRRIE